MGYHIEYLSSGWNRIFLPAFLCMVLSCSTTTKHESKEIRNMVDTIGFADNAIKMDMVIARIQQGFGELIVQKEKEAGITDDLAWKTVICPHDDYTYANYLYPLTLKHVRAKTVLMFGVAHKAKDFGLENELVFGTFPQWKSAYGPVRISDLREELIEDLDQNSYVVHDSMMMVEHSMEAIVPFLQYYNPDVEIVPVLVPYMSFDRISELAVEFSGVLNEILLKRKWSWGTDLAIVISTDAVHYGDRDWGGSDYAFMGADSAGYIKAKAHEMEIISNCLTGNLDPDRIKLFTEYTVRPDDYRQYQWTWCGRYSVPFGLMVSYDLGVARHDTLQGHLLAYSTSIEQENPDFTDIGMGVTAPANIHHWVGYASVGYE